MPACGKGWAPTTASPALPDSGRSRTGAKARRYQKGPACGPVPPGGRRSPEDVRLWIAASRYSESSDAVSSFQMRSATTLNTPAYAATTI